MFTGKRKSKTNRTSNSIANSQSFKKKHFTKSLKMNNIELAKELQEKRLKISNMNDSYKALISQTEEKFDALGTGIYQCMDQMSNIVTKLFDLFKLCQQKNIIYPKISQCIKKTFKKKKRLTQIAQPVNNMDDNSATCNIKNDNYENNDDEYEDIIEEITLENDDVFIPINDEIEKNDIKSSIKFVSFSPSDKKDKDDSTLQNKINVSPSKPTKSEKSDTCVNNQLESCSLPKSLTSKQLDNIELISKKRRSNLPLYDKRKSHTINKANEEACVFNDQVETTCDSSLLSKVQISDNNSNQDSSLIQTNNFVSDGSKKMENFQLILSCLDPKREAKIVTENIGNLPNIKSKPIQNSEPIKKQKNADNKINFLPKTPATNKNIITKKESNSSNLIVNDSSLFKSPIGTKVKKFNNALSKKPSNIVKNQVIMEESRRKSLVNAKRLSNFVQMKPSKNCVPKEKIDLLSHIGPETYEKELTLFARKDKILRTPIKIDKCDENVPTINTQTTIQPNNSIQSSTFDHQNTSLLNSQKNKNQSKNSLTMKHPMINLVDTSCESEESIASNSLSNSSLGILNMDVINNILNHDQLHMEKESIDCNITFNEIDKQNHDNQNNGDNSRKEGQTDKDDILERTNQLKSGKIEFVETDCCIRKEVTIFEKKNENYKLLDGYEPIANHKVIKNYETKKQKTKSNNSKSHASKFIYKVNNEDDYEIKFQMNRNEKTQNILTKDIILDAEDTMSKQDPEIKKTSETNNDIFIINDLVQENLCIENMDPNNQGTSRAEVLQGNILEHHDELSNGSKMEFEIPSFISSRDDTKSRNECKKLKDTSSNCRDDQSVNALLSDTIEKENLENPSFDSRSSYESDFGERRRRRPVVNYKEPSISKKMRRPC